MPPVGFLSAVLETRRKPDRCGAALASLGSRLSPPQRAWARAGGRTPPQQRRPQACSCSRPPWSAQGRWAARSPRRSPPRASPSCSRTSTPRSCEAGLEEARNVTSGQAGKLAERGKISAEQAEAQIEEVMGRITGTTTYREFGDVDFVVEAVPERMDDQADGARRARRRHAGPRDPRLEHLLAVDHRDGRSDAAPRQGDRLPLLLPRLGDAARRDRRGRRDLARDRSPPPSRSRRRSASSRSRASRCRASSSTASSTRASPRCGASRRRRASRSQSSTRASARRASSRSAPTASSTCSASTRCCTSPSTSSSPTARNASTCPRACRSSSPTASSAPRPAATASTTRRAPPTSRATPSPTCRSSSSCCR